MTKEQDATGLSSQRPTEDHRERFVVRGGVEGVPHAAMEIPEPTVDIEEVLRRLEWPERQRRHRRSEL